MLAFNQNPNAKEVHLVVRRVCIYFMGRNKKP
uniref:Uncharacterized protein n=1 Tax=Rhizophora mucronata TaxID=61149 RepID=A0A2P2NY33_RHIMU